MRALIFPILLCQALACNKSSSSSDDTTGPERNGKPVSSDSTDYLDFAPDISDDGEKIVFISGRASHSGSLKSYRFDSTDKSLERLTDLSSGQEVQVKISPNGGTVVVLAVDESGAKKVFVQDLLVPSARIEVPTNLKSLELMGFSPESSTVFGLIGNNSDNNPSFEVVSIAKSGSVISINSVLEVSGMEVTESLPTWVSNGGSPGIVTKKVISGTTSFVFRPVNGNGVFGESVTSLGASSSLGVVMGVDMVASTSSLFYTEKLLSENSYEPDGDKLEKVQVFPYQRVRGLSFDGETLNSLDYKLLTISGYSASRSGKLVMFGLDSFSCEGANQDITGQSLYLTNSSQDSQKIMIYDTYTPGGSSSAREIVNSSFCSKFDLAKSGAEQLADFQITNVALADNDSSWVMAIQSWHRGDDEIYLVSFDWDGVDINNIVFTNVSNNQKEGVALRGPFSYPKKSD